VKPHREKKTQTEEEEKREEVGKNPRPLDKGDGIEGGDVWENLHWRCQKKKDNLNLKGGEPEENELSVKI